MVELKVNEINKNTTSVRFGDAVYVGGKLYFACPLDNFTRMIFYTFDEDGVSRVWSSSGVASVRGKDVGLDKVLEHFSIYKDGLKLIPREKINMTIEINVEV